jgi:hypothetical protein
MKSEGSKSERTRTGHGQWEVFVPAWVWAFSSWLNGTLVGRWEPRLASIGVPSPSQMQLEAQVGKALPLLAEAWPGERAPAPPCPCSAACASASLDPLLSFWVPPQEAAKARPGSIP